jgi:hypothetical protein
MERPELLSFVEIVQQLMNNQDCYRKLQQCGFESLHYTDESYSKRTLSVIESFSFLSGTSAPER